MVCAIVKAWFLTFLRHSRLAAVAAFGAKFLRFSSQCGCSRFTNRRIMGHKWPVCDVQTVGLRWLNRRFTVAVCMCRFCLVEFALAAIVRFPVTYIIIMCKNEAENRAASVALSVFFTIFAKRQAEFGCMKTGFLCRPPAPILQKHGGVSHGKPPHWPNDNILINQQKSLIHQQQSFR